MRWKFFINEPIWALYLIPLSIAVWAVPMMVHSWTIKMMILLTMVFIIVFSIHEHYQVYKRKQEFNEILEELYGSGEGKNPRNV